MSRKFIVLPLLEIDRAAAEIADGADDGKATPHGRVARAWGRPVCVGATFASAALPRLL